MIDSNNKLKSLSKSLIESARKIMSEKKTDKDLAKLAPPYDKVTHGDVLVGRKVYTHDQVKAHKAKKGIKEDADMVVINAPVLADINGELAEVLKRDPRDKTVHIQLEGMKYILKKDQYEELPEAVKNPYAVGMAAAMKSTGDTPPLKKSTIKKAHEITKKVDEEVEQIDELSNRKLAAYANKANKQGVKIARSGVSKAPGFEDQGRKLRNRQDGEEMARTKLAMRGALRKEEVEDLEEVSKKTLASYIKKAVPSKRGLEDSSDRLHQKGHAAYTAGATKTSDKMLSLSQKQYDKATRRGEGINKAADKLAKEEFEQIDELSRKTLGSYVSKAAKSATQNIAGAVAAGVSGTPSQHGREMGRKSVQRLKGIDTAAKKLAKEDVELSQEEIDRLDAIMADLDEARGRPPKEGSAAWKAKQQQDLSDMPALGVQIRKAASINKPVTFMNGESKQISNGHINKFHDHLDARKTSQDKAAFQKRAHKSHDEFVKAVSEPVPGHSKDTGEIVKYR